MQIIASFAYFMHMIKSLAYYIMYIVQIWQKIWIRRQNLGKNDTLFFMI